MKLNEIDKVELEFLKLEDYRFLKEAMIKAYPTMPDDYSQICMVGLILKKNLKRRHLVDLPKAH